MQDFVRIRGEVVSNPLNENFRRLINEVSRANTNLIFPEKDAVVNTITNMVNIQNPNDAQTCYETKALHARIYYHVPMVVASNNPVRSIPL